MISNKVKKYVLFSEDFYYLADMTIAMFSDKWILDLN
jgi:hypothetical protein